MTNSSGILYIGVTNNLAKRVWEHKQKLVKGFTERYNISKLIYFEEFRTIQEAISREKELKGWRRSKKISLIKTENPSFKELINF